MTLNPKQSVEVKGKAVTLSVREALPDLGHYDY